MNRNKITLSPLSAVKWGPNAESSKRVSISKHTHIVKFNKIVKLLLILISIFNSLILLYIDSACFLRYLVHWFSVKWIVFGHLMIYVGWLFSSCNYAVKYRETAIINFVFAVMPRQLLQYYCVAVYISTRR